MGEADQAVALATSSHVSSRRQEIDHQVQEVCDEGEAALVQVITLEKKVYPAKS